MKKIYIAGKLNDDAVGYIQNLARMFRLANAAREAGFAVFVPGLDVLQGLISGNWGYRQYFDNSQPWLIASDGILVVEEKWRTSSGTKRELETAERHSIPIWYASEENTQNVLREMKRHFGMEDKK